MTNKSLFTRIYSVNKHLYSVKIKEVECIGYEFYAIEILLSRKIYWRLQHFRSKCILECLYMVILNIVLVRIVNVYSIVSLATTWSHKLAHFYTKQNSNQRICANSSLIYANRTRKTTFRERTANIYHNTKGKKILLRTHKLFTRGWWY